MFLLGLYDIGMFFFSKQKGASMKLSETFGPKQNQNGRISSYAFCLKDHPMYLPFGMFTSNPVGV